MTKLKEDFEANGGKWKKWKMGDLFVPSNGNFDIQQIHINGKGDYVVSSGEQNGGIIGRTDIPALIFEKNTITVDMFGNVFYRDFNYKMVTHARVFSLKLLNEKFTEKAVKYVASNLNFLKEYFCYSNMASWNKIEKMDIKLPALNNQPAYNYMEQYISLLEEEKMLQVDKFLKDSGLNNITLTAEETAALEKFRNAKVKFKEWKICGDDGVFSVNNTHSILQSWIEENSGEYPYCTASESNNSVSSYISYDMGCIEKGNSIMIGGKTLVVTYQEKDYFSNDSHNLALYSKDVLSKNKECQLFLVSQLYKCLKPIYYWGDSISKTKIQKDIISLPLNGSDGIDYDFMHHFISAQEKLAIKGVVKYKNEALKASSKII